MGKIKALDTQLTNMIAAGEVVERPMGIVKELVENAIDAGATRIEVIITQGGMDSLEVRDDGTGMDFDDALMAFERHATSKISSSADLFNIHTMGFRGEALPSIASVSKTELITSNGESGTHVLIDQGKLVVHEAYGADQGTSVKVSELFYKTPARLKHLKSPSYEASLINDVVQKFALAHPDIAFVLNSDGKESFRTNGQGDLAEVIFRMYGKDVARHAFEINGEDLDYTLSGMIIHPQFNRANRYGINIFLNKRLVRPYRLQKVIVEEAQKYMPDDRYPICILNINMDAQLVDVNVHPGKWEVRLSKEQQLEYLVRETIKKTLEENMGVTARQVHFTEKVENVPLVFDTYEKPVHKENTEYRPVPPVNMSTPLTYPDMVKDEVHYEPVYQSGFPQLRVIGQLHGKFILCEGDQGLYVVDQHAAQERVHYEEINAAMDKGMSDSIECLIPVLVHTSADVVDRIDELNRWVAGVGIEFEAFGDSQLIARSIPLWMQDIEEVTFLSDLVDYFKEGKEVVRIELLKHKIATMACHRSIRFNRVLTPDEMVQVIDQLSRCKQPYHCPHGRPVFYVIEDAMLEKEFLR